MKSNKKSITQYKHRRWPVRWTELEQVLIIEGAKKKNLCPTQFIRTSSLNKASSLRKKIRESPQTDEQQLRRKFFNYNINKGWLKTADGLKEIAEILKSSRSKYSNFDIIWHELLIWGFCLENLLKGLYSKKQGAGLLKDKEAKPLNEDGKLSSTKRDHNLEKWCQRAEVSNFNSTKQKNILRILSQTIYYHGRYPTPTNCTKSEPVSWSDLDYDNILIEMINFLRQEIAGIE